MLRRVGEDGDGGGGAEGCEPGVGTGGGVE